MKASITYFTSAIFALISCSASVSAFTSSSPASFAVSSKYTVLNMFDAGDGDDESKTRDMPILDTKNEGGGILTPKQFRDENTQWVDDREQANTNPFLISPWAVLLIAYPVTLLLNDVFHFIPEGSILNI